MTLLKDSFGLAFNGASRQSLDQYDAALRLFQCYIGDPVAAVDKALETSPGFVMAHVLKAYLHLLGTEPAALPVARACHAAAMSLSANDRECGHLTAIGYLLEGRWFDASRALEDVAIAYPHDILALQAGHQVDFFTGNATLLRDRIARALPFWNVRMPGYHAMLGMHAFGLEETGDYQAAEAQGRRSVELEPRDGWGQHAVAHVMEMQGRQQDGIGWMRANPAAWSTDSFFAVHNWWHLALFHLDLDQVNETLSLFDNEVYGKKSGVILEMIDASAMLWRLHLRGVDVANRWEAVADNWKPVATAGNYAFNDAHAVMAFAGAGRMKDVDAVLEAQREALGKGGDNVMFIREVGYAVAHAIKAFAIGNYAETVELLRPVRNIAHRFGGSHAQRDVLSLTLIEAAFRSGQRELASALAAERLALKPGSAQAKRFVARADIAKAA